MINTGAKLPDAANAVIQIEDTHVHEYHPAKKDGLDEKSIRINTECSMNQDIRYGLESQLSKEAFRFL